MRMSCFSISLEHLFSGSRDGHGDGALRRDFKNKRRVYEALRAGGPTKSRRDHPLYAQQTTMEVDGVRGEGLVGGEGVKAPPPCPEIHGGPSLPSLRWRPLGPKEGPGPLPPAEGHEGRGVGAVDAVQRQERVGRPQLGGPPAFLVPKTGTEGRGSRRLLAIKITQKSPSGLPSLYSTSGPCTDSLIGSMMASQTSQNSCNDFSCKFQHTDKTKQPPKQKKTPTPVLTQRMVASAGGSVVGPHAPNNQ